ncbi:MAG TPA: hypothetical protein VEP90_20630 [Methylomirabilota bacterium]|nr:hypothetical protein [Methylomirabilota bacterium]
MPNSQNEQTNKARAVIMTLGGMIVGGLPNLSIETDLIVEQDIEAIEIIKNHFNSAGWIAEVQQYLPEGKPEGAAVYLTPRKRI